MSRLMLILNKLAGRRRTDSPQPSEREAGIWQRALARSRSQAAEDARTRPRRQKRDTVLLRPLMGEGRGQPVEDWVSPQKGGRRVVKVTRLDGKEIVVNAFLIETVESVPDTVISLTTGRKLLVRETVEDIIRLVQQFHRGIGQAAAVQPAADALEG